MKMVLRYLTRLSLSLALVSAAAAPLFAADDLPATVRRVAATAALAAEEYRNGVQGGRIVAQSEVDEAKLFLAESGRAAALLPAPGGASTVAGGDRLWGLVA